MENENDEYRKYYIELKKLIVQEIISKLKSKAINDIVCGWVVFMEDIDDIAKQYGLKEV